MFPFLNSYFIPRLIFPVIVRRKKKCSASGSYKIAVPFPFGSFSQLCDKLPVVLKQGVKMLLFYKLAGFLESISTSTSSFLPNVNMRCYTFLPFSRKRKTSSHLFEWNQDVPKRQYLEFDSLKAIFSYKEEIIFFCNFCTLWTYI